MRNFFAKSALAAAILSLVPVAALASGPRVEGLGLQGDYVQDYVNIYNYPGSIVRYQNLVYGNFGRIDASSAFQDNNPLPSAIDNADRGMGAYVSLCKKLPGTWGVQINENRNPLSPAYGPSYWNRDGNEGLTLLWGDKLGSKSSIGFTLEKAGSRGEDATSFAFPFEENSDAFASLAPAANARAFMNAVNDELGSSNGRNSWGVGGGISTSWSSKGRDHMAEFGIHYRNNSLHVPGAAATQLTEDNGNTDIAINARMQCAVSDNTYFTPVINFYTMNRGTKFTDTAAPATDTDFKNKVSGFNIGMAETWVLHETDMLVLGVSVNREKIDWKDPAAAGTPFTITYMNSPTVFGSLEVHPKTWWHVRLGAGKPVWSKLTIEDPAKTTFKDSPFQYAVGTGFRLGGSLDLDAVMNQNYAFNAGWLGSGNNGAPFSSLSATYRF